MMMLLIAAVLALLLAGTDIAQAFFLIGAVVAAIGLTGFAATVATAVIGIGIAVGLSYVASKLLAKKEDSAVNEAVSAYAGGVQLSIRAAADVPQSLLVGRAVTAGSLVYAKTFGVRGDIDNSDLIEVVALADHPCTALHKIFVDGQEKTTAADDGYNGRHLDGYDNKLALKFYDGTQVAADQYTLDNLSTATDNPWTADFIGTGITYARLHSIYDTEKVPGQMRWRFVVDGIALYDPRKDSTVSGGSGAHRWGTLATYEWTQNVAVICYNILRGVYVNGEIFYGLEGTTADQLPLDVWFAAMNECDVAIDLDAGGTEPQFVCGGEISVDTEPLAAIKELLKASGGRLTENGGVYKLYLGAPGLPVVSFTDGSLLLNHEDIFKPILRLESRVNYLTGTYTSPSDGWLPKVAPPREDVTFRAQDGRRLPADLNVPMVQSGTQMQRLMLQLLQRARRQRSHIVHLPPTAYILEPGDTVQWDSARNGYTAKLFESDQASYANNFNVTLAITEIDPADYDWSTADELPEVDGKLVTVLPAPKIIEGFDAEAFLQYGDGGTIRNAIRVLWDIPTDGDLTSVRAQLRVQSDPSNFTTGSSDDVAAGQMVFAGGLQSLTVYEARGRFESFNGYASEWSLWVPVTTLDDRTESDLAGWILQIVQEETNIIRQRLADTDAFMGTLAAKLASADLLDKDVATRELKRTEGNVTAGYLEEIVVATGPDSALVKKTEELDAAIVTGDAEVTANFTEVITVFAEAVETADGLLETAIVEVDQRLTAKANDQQAQLKTRFVVGVTPDGAIASYELTATAEQASAGMRVVAYQSGTERYGLILMDSDRFYVGKTGAAGYSPVFIVDTENNRVILNADLIANGSISALKLDVENLSSISANLGTIIAGLLTSADGLFQVDLTNGRILISDG